VKEPAMITLDGFARPAAQKVVEDRKAAREPRP
jgi:hypothetical protein